MTTPQHSILLIGSTTFVQQGRSQLQGAGLPLAVHTTPVATAWSLIVTEKPSIVCLEISANHSTELQNHYRKLLQQIRERFAENVYTIVALRSSEQLMFGGDLLFLNDTSLHPSGFVDAFIAQPPGMLVSAPPIPQQLEDCCLLALNELNRRASGAPALPALGSAGWVQSCADPESRKLWMVWLPRYASYTNENPIIVGPTGSGKTNVARALHELSGLSGKFVSITPRDFSSSELVQAELFGAVAGAYTGAVDKWGLVRQAEGGTLFIDELQSIDTDLQGKLITFLENKCYRRVGSSETVEANVRFVFASNRSLKDLIREGKMRDDFAYRLERLHVSLPPLEQRPLDTSAALAFALAKIHRQRPYRQLISGFTPEAYRLLFTHSWPGNLRQLENNVARLMETTSLQNESLIGREATLAIVTSELAGSGRTAEEIIAQGAHSAARTILSDQVTNLKAGVAIFTDAVRTAALHSSGGSVATAAELIDDNEATLAIVAERLASEVLLGKTQEDS